MKKKNICILIIMLFFISCINKHKRTDLYGFEITKRKIFINNTLDSLKIDSLNRKSIEFAEKCKRENLDCIEDGYQFSAEFFGGMHRFRELLSKNLKINTKSMRGENKIRIVIGNHNNIEKIEVIKFTNIETKNQILKILNSDDFKKWISANYYGIKVKEQIDFSIKQF